MAASLSSVQRVEEFKEEFLTCSLCVESYDNEEHQAKCLPCLHTYCQSCLQRHVSGKPKFNCPTCRCLITLPGETVASLTNNFFVENLKGYQDIFNHAVICGNCDKGHSAASFCHDCGSFQCQSCMDNHSLMRSTRNHDLVPMSELQEKKCNPMMQKQLYCTKTLCITLNYVL